MSDPLDMSDPALGCESVMMETEKFCERMDRDLAAMNDDQATKSKTNAQDASGWNKQAVSKCPVLKMQGNERLAQEFASAPKADHATLFACFDQPAVANMKTFFACERFARNDPEGEPTTGGGLMCAATRSFQNCDDAGIITHNTAHFFEALWQFKTMVWCQSSSDKQRRQQAMLQDLVSLQGKRDGQQRTMHWFFNNTHEPRHNEMPRHYGRRSPNSMLNCLPIPRVINVEFGERLPQCLQIPC